jgi:hypothetical protein
MQEKIDLKKIGAAQAALLSSMLGILALALVNLGTEISKAFQTRVHNLGMLWMPGAEGIGPYSGKETISLVVWLASWFLLHRLLRAKEWNHQAVIAFFLMGIACATTLLWPPVFSLLAHH